VVYNTAALGCIKLLIAAMQQFAINVLEHAAIHAANESLQNLTASTNFYQVGVVRFQHDITEMFLVVLHLLITY